MGWSCAAAAGHTMDRMVAACRKENGSSNTFTAGGKTYFWETSRREHNDGAITGSVFVVTKPGWSRKSGSFRIDSDGKMVRGPAALRRLIESVKDCVNCGAFANRCEVDDNGVTRCSVTGTVHG